MIEKDNQARDFLSFQVNRRIKALYKSFLLMLEEIKDTEGEISDSSFQRCRKKILDNGNDAIREIEDALEKLEISVK